SRLSTINHQLDAAIIAVPSDTAVAQAFQLVRGAGQILLFAHTKRAAAVEGREPQPSTLDRFRPSTLDFSQVCLDEKDLIGSYSADFTIQKEVAKLVFSRKLDVRPLISHHFPLEKTADAVELAAHPQPDSLKILVKN